MNDKLTGLYIKARTRIDATRNDDGQGALEYVGILAVVVLLVGVVAAAFTTGGQSVTTSIGQWFTDILDGQ